MQSNVLAFPASSAREQLEAIEAEAAVIGGMLIGGTDAILAAADILEEHDFTRAANRVLFRHFLELQREGTEVDVITLSDALSAAGDMKTAGGVPYLSKLLDSTPTSANIGYHARIVREKAHLRRLHAIGGDLQAIASSGKDALAVQDEAERLVFAAGQHSASDSPLASINTVLWEAMEALEAEEPGVPTGFADLDHMTGGLERGSLVIVAARPSMGKTAFATQAATNAAAKSEGRAVAIFSLEMTRRAIGSRLLFTEARVDGAALKRYADRDALARIAQASAFLNGLPLWVHDRATTVREIRSHCRKLAAKGGLELVVIDYLGKMHGTGKADNRVHELGEITGDLKRLAVELDIPVVLLAQLSRKVEERPDKRPMMSDLRDSGEIEQDADTIAFLYRPEYYYGPRDKDGNNLEGIAEIIIGKQRNGATGTVNLAFRKEFTRFEDFANPGGR